MNKSLTKAWSLRTRRRTYLKDSRGIDSALVADPTSHIVDVWDGGGDGDEANRRTASLHARDDDLKGAAAGFI